MYNYNFECEKIILELVDKNISIDDKEYRVNIIITEDNLLIFENVKANSTLTAKGISEMPEYSLIVKLKINDINYEVDDENTIIDLPQKEIILYQFDLSELKFKLFCDKSVIY